MNHMPITRSEGKSLSAVYEREHFVQFYQEHGELLDNLKHFIGAGLKSGYPSVVIATPSHLEALAKELTACGIDIEQEIEQRRYLALDAAETLKLFMVKGLPRRDLFNATLKGLFSKLADKRPARAFGEMVALLWEQGNETAAVLLEQYWNDITSQESFTLFCAYPKRFFPLPEHSSTMSEIAHLHSSVID